VESVRGWSPVEVTGSTGSPYWAPGAFPDEPVSPVPTANDVAIAALIVSLVWLAGVGSMVAIVLAVIALRKRAVSQGRIGGRGMAWTALLVGVAGLVIGVFVLISLVGLGRRAATAIHDLNKITTMPIGMPAHVSTTFGEGLTTVTVYSVDEPVIPSGEESPPAAGDEFAVADAQLCAGPNGAPLFGISNSFSLVFADGSRVMPSVLSAESPAFSGSGTIAADRCSRGFITFEIPSGSVPSSIEFRQFGTYAWKLGGPSAASSNRERIVPSASASAIASRR
jgi:hypothetical protein